MLSPADRNARLQAGGRFRCKLQKVRHARMAELADAPDLESGGAILVGSSPSPGICTDTLIGRGERKILFHPAIARNRAEKFREAGPWENRRRVDRCTELSWPQRKPGAPASSFIRSADGAWGFPHFLRGWGYHPRVNPRHGRCLPRCLGGPQQRHCSGSACQRSP